jgi:hypothetical protein
MMEKWGWQKAEKGLISNRDKRPEWGWQKVEWSSIPPFASLISTMEIGPYFAKAKWSWRKTD